MVGTYAALERSSGVQDASRGTSIRVRPGLQLARSRVPLQNSRIRVRLLHGASARHCRGPPAAAASNPVGTRRAGGAARGLRRHIWGYAGEEGEVAAVEAGDVEPDRPPHSAQVVRLQHPQVVPHAPRQLRPFHSPLPLCRRPLPAPVPHQSAPLLRPPLRVAPVAPARPHQPPRRAPHAAPRRDRAVTVRFHPVMKWERESRGRERGRRAAESEREPPRARERASEREEGGRETGNAAGGKRGNPQKDERKGGGVEEERECVYLCERGS